MNWDKIEQLLNVFDKVKDHPQLKAIANEVLNQLAGHNNHALTPQRPTVLKPTREELEKILQEPDEDVTVKDDGSVEPAVKRREV